MTLTSLIDGQPGNAVDSNDRGLQYGDGVFETLAVHAGRCEFWDAHLQRLRLGCQRLGLQCPSDTLLRSDAAQLIQDVDRGVLKIIVTRGQGGRGYRIPESEHTRRILSSSGWPNYPDSYSQQGVQIRLCDLRLSRQPALAGLKHLNRLEQVLARMEWSDPDIAEGLLRDSDDQLIEGTFSNLFLVHGDRLSTPRLDQCGVAGIMRGIILQCAADLGIPCSEGRLSLQDLQRADEIFLTNSIIGIWPVNRCGDWSAPIGPLTQRLQQALEKARQEDWQR